MLRPVAGHEDDAVRAPGQRPGSSLVTRVVVVNAAILVAAGLLLLATPVTVSSPVAVQEAAIILAGVCLMLILNAVLVRQALLPLGRLADQMERFDPLRPGARAPGIDADAELTRLAEAFDRMLRWLEEERRAGAQRALGAQEDERRRVARELHDGVGQALTGVLLQVDQAIRTAPAERRGELEEIRTAARSAMDDVRRIALRLRPQALDELGLPAALRGLAASTARHSELRTTCRLQEELPPLSAAAELVIYRVAQEALTNAVRHARATSVEVRLDATERGVALTVTDDGQGVDERAGRLSGGLRGMRERAVLVDAVLSITSPAGGGTAVRLEVPTAERPVGGAGRPAAGSPSPAGVAA